MKEEAIKYVQHQLVQASAGLKPYVYNEGGTPYPKRHIFKKIEKYAGDLSKGRQGPRWIIIPGLRGVGKTTILAQIYHEFGGKPYDSTHILYVSLDHVVNVLNLSLNEILDAYQDILGISFEKLDKPILLLVDEVQYDQKWAAVLKSLYDRSRNIAMICSGSSAVQLQSNPDVIRRAVFEKLYPMNFLEFETIKSSGNVMPMQGLKQKIKKAIYFSSSANEVHDALKKIESSVLTYWSKVDTHDIDEYLTIGTLPFALRTTDKAKVFESLNLLLDKITAQDILALGRFDQDTLSNIKRLLYIFADTNGVLSINKITQLLPFTRVTVMNVLEVLEKAELLIRIRPYGSHTTDVRKPSKYLFMTPAIRAALLSITGREDTFLKRRGALLEDIVALQLYREFVATGAGTLSYDSSEGASDFVLQVGNHRQIAIEVGAGDDKGIAQLKSTMEKIECDFGIVFCPGDMALVREEKFIKIPPAYSLLM